MKFFNIAKKFGSKAVQIGKAVKDKALSLLGLGATAAAVSGTPAHADLATDMGTITTAATDGIATVGTSQATVVAAVFGLILLAVGSRWIFSSIKAR